MSITSYPQKLSNNYFFNIGLGDIPGTSQVHKFGAVPAMSNNTSGTIWDVNDTFYPWSSFSTAFALTIPAVNASDDGKDVTIIGLDASYNEISEEITVSSSASVTTTNTFIRVYRAYVSGGGTNVANINMQIFGTTVCRINAGKGQTLMAIYTVPAGYTGYIMQGTATCQYGADATGDMFVRYFGQTAFRVGHSFEFSGAGGQYFYKFTVPVVIPEKSDIDIRASVRSNNARLTAAFDIILVEN